MAGADYMHCDVCGRKAYYDADTDYGNAFVVALCRACAEGGGERLLSEFVKKIYIKSEGAV